MSSKSKNATSSENLQVIGALLGKTGKHLHSAVDKAVAKSFALFLDCLDEACDDISVDAEEVKTAVLKILSEKANLRAVPKLAGLKTTSSSGPRKTTAWNMYIKEEGERIRKEVKGTDTNWMKEASTQFKALSKEEKKEYQNAADEANEGIEEKKAEIKEKKASKKKSSKKAPKKKRSSKPKKKPAKKVVFEDSEEESEEEVQIPPKEADESEENTEDLFSSEE